MLRRKRFDRWLTCAVVGAVVALGAVLMAAPASSAADPSTVTVDGTSAGRTFDGVGALSAGASSRLLIDYPEPQRSQVLDYLFTPGYGAALQILKVEIGGDTNSTDGAEPSHMRSATEVDCDRGYEWWLMEQAKKRNPAIKLSALEWGTPGWVGAGARTVWTSQNLTYLLSWLGCAQQHGLRIDYLGGWNEAGYNADWYVSLRKALDEHGYGDIQIVADDSYDWTSVAASMATDPAFKESVAAIGEHYPCAETCSTPASVLDTGKPIWASEQGSNPYNAGAERLAADLNREYVDGQMTSTINWSLEWSAYQNLPFDGNGLLLANTPWSGHYEVGKSIWAMAHTAQFTAPGWRYLDSGSTRIPGGSVVSLRAADSGNWSSIAETTDATAAQQVSYAVGGGLSDSTVHVWSTDLGSDDPSSWFVRQADIRPHAGRFTATLQPGRLYTFTTTSGQQHGTAAAPPDRAWPLPYNESFDHYRAGATPRYFSDLEGGFETAPCDGRPGGCLQQVVTDKPVYWDYWYDHPATVVGDPTSWRSYQFDTDARLQEPGYVELDGRAEGPGDGVSGYHFRISDTGQWSVYRRDDTGLNSNPTDHPLATGSAAFGVGRWHRIGLRLQGDEITPILDGAALTTVLDPTYANGQVGIEVSPWTQAQFDNLHVAQLPVNGAGPRLGAITPDPARLSSPGESLQLATSVTNAGRLPASAVAAQLHLPDGWSGGVVAAPPSTLAAGQSAPVAWRVTSPASATPGTYPATITVSYVEGGLHWIATKTVPVYLDVVPQGDMTATASSAQSGYPASNAIDGNPSTLWHTAWSPVRVYPPQSITLDLGGSYDVQGLQYLTRQDGNPNGVVTAYKIFVSADGNTFTQATSGAWSADETQKQADFTASAIRYVRLEADQGGGGYVCAAEVNVLGIPHS
jgi:O-glycosyl hydrolase